jgi:hypothetical protein
MYVPFSLFCVLFLRKCVLYCCQRLSTQFRLNIYSIIFIMFIMHTYFLNYKMLPDVIGCYCYWSCASQFQKLLPVCRHSYQLFYAIFVSAASLDCKDIHILGNAWIHENRFWANQCHSLTKLSSKCIVSQYFTYIIFLLQLHFCWIVCLRPNTLSNTFKKICIFLR